MRRLPMFIPACFMILFTCAGVIFSAGESFAEEPAELRIVRITPAGQDVPPGRQIVIQFNRAVVPVGRMERRASEIPITISARAGLSMALAEYQCAGLSAGREIGVSTRYPL